MMENETSTVTIAKKLRRWLITIVILLSLNLLMTICLFPSSSDNSEFTDNSKSPLPSGLRSSNEREKLFKSLTEVYNSRDYHGIWTLLSPAFKIKNPEDSLPTVMSRLYVLADSITDGIYDHYDALGSQDGSNVYQLYYQVHVDKGRTGTVTIEVVKYDSESYQCNGFKINVN